MSRKLPGDKNHRELVEETIRVNYSGEYGAKRIYEGQLLILKDTESEALISHMKEQELKHLEYFEGEMLKRHIRPSIFQPLWHVAGFALGAATALMGKKAAMVCTEAVEEVINEHYKEQIGKLGEDEALLKENIEKFRLEELEHRDYAITQGSRETVAYTPLKFAIATISKVSIFLAKRF